VKPKRDIVATDGYKLTLGDDADALRRLGTEDHLRIVP
jgi:hypothetical protein